MRASKVGLRIVQAIALLVYVGCASAVEDDDEITAGESFSSSTRILSLAEPLDGGTTSSSLRRPQQLSAVLHCVTSDPTGQLHALFGYHNPGATREIPVGPFNTFVPRPFARGQPTTFFPGDIQNAVNVPLQPHGVPLIWRLGRSMAFAWSGSPRCAPRFAGATAAELISSTSVLLTWSPAMDFSTDASNIVYDVCISNLPGDCSANFVVAATSAPGATRIEVDELGQAATFYFLVRARNEAGERDRNTAEVSVRTCSEGQTSCERDTCAWLSHDPENCGSCGNRCAASGFGPDAVCSLGTCCPAGMELCDGQCAAPPCGPLFAGAKTARLVQFVGVQSVQLSWDVATDPTTNESEMTYLVCMSATSGACASDFVVVARQTGVTAWGTFVDPGATYYFVVRAMNRAGQMDANTIEVSARACPADESMCEDGTCVPVVNDSRNCGACGNECGPNYFCLGRMCCESGSVLCDGLCTPLARDPGNCGSCGHKCDAAAPYCVSGQCAPCPSGQTSCGGSCTYTDMDAQNCGACGHACAGATPYCTRGVCSACQDSAVLCDGQCRTLGSDVANCGGCGQACQAPYGRCTDGQCVLCEPQETLCDGRCVSLDWDFNNCGQCGNVCGPGAQCASGSCFSCPEGQCLIPGSVPQCVLPDSPLNCGACGRQCALGWYCVNRECWPGPCAGASAGTQACRP